MPQLKTIIGRNMTTQSFPLQLQNGHLFTGISGQTFLLDTGAPTGFGTDSPVTLHDMTFDLPSSYLGDRSKPV
jgi:hypothetical protein